MKIYASDKFFLPDQPIKVALIETDENASILGAVSKAQPASADSPEVQSDAVKMTDDVPRTEEIDGEVRLWKDGAQVSFTPNFLPRKPIQGDLRKLPTLAFEIPGKTLNPGIYQIEFLQTDRVVARKEVNVLPEEGYKYITNQLRHEDFLTESGPKFSIMQAWNRSWARLLSYAGVAALPQISFH